MLIGIVCERKLGDRVLTGRNRWAAAKADRGEHSGRPGERVWCKCEDEGKCIEKVEACLACRDARVWAGSQFDDSVQESDLQGRRKDRQSKLA